MQLHGKTNFHFLSLLAGLCFFLSALEYMIPKPLPFIRLGLANLPLLLALDILPFPSFLLLCGLKISGQALITGTLFSYVFIFSLGGTGVSAILMYAIRKNFGKEKISLIGISSTGAIASNGTTLILAYYFVFGESIRYVIVPVLALGIVTGILLGIIVEYFIRNSIWYSRGEDTLTVTQGEINHGVSRSFNKNFREAREDFYIKTFNSNELAIAGLCMIPALLFNPDTKTRIIQFLFFWVILWLSGKKHNPIITISIILGIVFFNLLIPYGEILFSIGQWKITSGAFMGGLRRAVTLEGLFMLSRSCIRSDLALPGTFGKIIGESLRIFSGMAEEKVFFNKQNWIERLDGLLIHYGENQPASTEKSEVINNPKKTTGRIILIAVIILAWLPFLFKA
ncbi:MAG: Gx transporter family protein [Treponema sp.]|jgi:heptaprenyl diphosphate synthase|nr:Gx transporter family protein [Treponema sp.]